MRSGRPSATARRVALRRAAHQVLDQPLVLNDPLALAIAAEDAQEIADDPASFQDRASRALRAFLVVRSRYAEDQLEEAVRCGVRQYVVLGAGLDTFAFRNPFAPDGLHVYEVDHPSTQEWKQSRLARAGIPIPPSLTFAPADFEEQTLKQILLNAGFRQGEPAFFAWLGVTPYLTETAFSSTLNFIVEQASGSGVSFDFAVVRQALTPFERLALDALSRRVARAGEPFQLFFDPPALKDRLFQTGFRRVEMLGKEDLNQRYFASRSDGLRVSGGLGQMVTAWL